MRFRSRALLGLRVERVLSEVRAVDSSPASVEPHQTRAVVRHGEHLDARVLRLHNFQEGNALDENGSKRLASVGSRSRRDHGHYQARARHVPGALAEARALVLGHHGSFHDGVADSLADAIETRGRGEARVRGEIKLHS